MSRAGRRLAPLVAAAALLAAGAGAAPPGPGAAAEYFTNLPLVDHRGRAVRFFDDLLRDRVVVVTGFYVNCETTSPLQNTVLSRLQQQLGEAMGRDVWFVSITVDPTRDTPEAVARYAELWRPGPGWRFLTGKPENVDWVNYKLGQYLEDPEEHEGLYLLGNLRTGLWLKAPPRARVEELRQLLEQLRADRGGG